MNRVAELWETRLRNLVPVRNRLCAVTVVCRPEQRVIGDHNNWRFVGRKKRMPEPVETRRQTCGGGKGLNRAGGGPAAACHQDPQYQTHDCQGDCNGKMELCRGSRGQ